MKYYILTIGCQMNKSDSERIARVLSGLNYEPTDEEYLANVIVVNACSVRQSGINRIFSKIHNWNKRKVKQKNSSLITVLTGCVLPKDKKKFEKIFDIVMNIKDLKKLPELLNEKSEDLLSKEEQSYFSVKPIYQSKSSAFVPIMTGCNNFCTYCAVPYTRGREISRSVQKLIDEISDLVKNGYKEIILLGQNVNTYKPPESKIKSVGVQNLEPKKSKVSFSKNNPYKDFFAALLWEINQIKKLNRLHFTAPHPKDMSDEVIDALTLPKMVNFLHLPVQSGDDEVLKRMNRNYTASDFLKLIKKIKQKKPDIALGTDIIVGFPGETKKQFENTVKLYNSAEFDISYTAKYSPRSGTAAYKFEDDVELDEKKRRWFVLQELMEKIALEKNQKYLNKTVEVLVDKVSEKKGGPASNLEAKPLDYLYEGNSREYKRVRFFSSNDLRGEIVNVKIDKVMLWMLEGEQVILKN